MTAQNIKNLTQEKFPKDLLCLVHAALQVWKENNLPKEFSYITRRQILPHIHSSSTVITKGLFFCGVMVSISVMVTQQLDN